MSERLCPGCGLPLANYSAKRCRPCTWHRPTPVRHAMTRRGLGVAEVATRAGVGVTAVKRAAAGQTLGRSAAVAIGRALGINPAVLILGWDGTIVEDA